MNNQMRSHLQLEKSPSVQHAKRLKEEQKAAVRNDLNTETYIPIKDFKVGRYYQIVFIYDININESMITSNGCQFARIKIKDVTGELDGVVWNINNVTINKGSYYKMRFDVKEYKNIISFTVDAASVEEVDVPLNVYDYVKGISESSLSACAISIEEAFEMMSDEHYKNIIGNAIQRLDLINALKMSPYGLDGPLAYKGGLIVHVAGSLRLAKVIAEQAKDSEMPLNVSLVLAACILRNIGWHTTTAFINGRLRPKDAFYMTGVNNASARYVDHLMIHVESDLDMKIPESKKQALENSCGEISNIKTIEGRIAASTDNMMNLLHFGSEALQRKTQDNWTDDFFTGHNK